MKAKLVPPENPTPDEVQVTMSYRDAVALFQLCYNHATGPDSGPRGATNRFHRVLCDLLPGIHREPLCWTGSIEGGSWPKFQRD